jgi:hypothetical protein
MPRRVSVLIQIDIVDYDNLSSLGMRITKYVNSNLRDIVRVLIDTLEIDSEFGLDGFFPRDYLMRKPRECRNAVNELYEIICSKNIRNFIKPKYEYLLYTILCWWEECADDEEDLIINPVDDELKRDLTDNDEDGQNVLRWIQDFEEYYDMCFQDHDFLPEQLNNMVTLYLGNPKMLEILFHYDNLDDYVDLMDCDLRERYLEKRDEKNESSFTSLSEKIVEELMSIIRRFQKRIVHFEKRDEVEITADIQDAIAGSLNSKYDLHISREFTMGRAMKKLGETDLYIYSEKNGCITECAVLENKNIENFTDQYYQLMGYLNQNFEFGITLSLNREMSLKEGFDEIAKKLNNIEGAFKPVKIEKIREKETSLIISEHIVPETGNRMKVFHLIFQLNDSERKAAAVSARKVI